MKTILTAALTLAALAVPAFAADMPVKAPVAKAPLVAPAYNWSGGYIGGHIGYLWGRSSVWDDGVLTESKAPTDGAVGGLLAGYNWQSGAFVYGIEGDFGWSNAHGIGQAVVVTNEVNHYDFNWTGHVRGRLGYAANNWLLFLAGGLALADIDYRQTATSSIILGSVYTGWSIGGGLDYAINPQWVGRIEYLYDDFGSKTYIIGGDPYRVKVTGQTLRGAIILRY